MTLDLIGRILICATLVCGTILFVKANLNYLPKTKEDPKDSSEGNKE